MTPDLWMLVMVTAGLAASAWLGGMAGWVVRERRADAEIANHAFNNWQEGREYGRAEGYDRGYRDGKNNKKRRDRRDTAVPARPAEFAVGAERDLWGNPVDARRKRGTAKQTFPIDVKGTRR